MMTNSRPGSEYASSTNCMLSIGWNSLMVTAKSMAPAWTRNWVRWLVRHVKCAGWSEAASITPMLDHFSASPFQNTQAGGDASRAYSRATSAASALTAGILIAKLFGERDTSSADASLPSSSTLNSATSIVPVSGARTRPLTSSALRTSNAYQTERSSTTSAAPPTRALTPPAGSMMSTGWVEFGSVKRMVRSPSGASRATASTTAAESNTTGSTPGARSTARPPASASKNAEDDDARPLAWTRVASSTTSSDAHTNIPATPSSKELPAATPSASKLRAASTLALATDTAESCTFGATSPGTSTAAASACANNSWSSGASAVAATRLY
mmetsp:Transcript_3360/g.12193  ORF Transcript_3360/g.12193 Transcript_3360/m.12193 type:complete len:328 (+) Transcript_3360:1514-2497(+)